MRRQGLQTSRASRAPGAGATTTRSLSRRRAAAAGGGAAEAGAADCRMTIRRLQTGVLRSAAITTTATAAITPNQLCTVTAKGFT